VGAAVDRIGRNQLDVLFTADHNHKAGRILVTYGHYGPWNLDDPSDESRLSMDAFGAQMELRAIQKRNREETQRARDAGEVRHQPSYGYQFIRRGPNLPVDHVALDPVAAEAIRNVARRLLTDKTGKITCSTEAARLSRAKVLSPADHRAVLYGKEPKGSPWHSGTLRFILRSEAALGYLIHKEEAVLGTSGEPVRIAEGLWEHATRLALIEKTKPSQIARGAARAPRGTTLLSACADCGNCTTERLYPVDGSYICNARVRNVQTSQHCKPAPSIRIKKLNDQVTVWFLARYGSGQVIERAWDPGTGYAARITEMEANRDRLKRDRNAGLYDSPAEEEWFRREYRRMSQEISKLAELSDQPASMRLVPTGQTVAEKWKAAPDDAARREILNEYNVRVTVYPTTAETRVQITGIALPVSLAA